MVKKYLILAFLCILFFSQPGNSAEKGAELIIKEIEDTFAEDILTSKEVNERRKYFRANPEAFERGPAGLFLQHSDPKMTLKTIIGEENFHKIPEIERTQIIETLKNTFRRYAYEWLDSNLNTDLKLHKINLLDDNNAILIVERDMKIVPDLDLKLFVHKTDLGWKVFDFGFWDFRYTKMKRSLYLRYIKKNDIEGLVRHLETKNTKFFN